MIADPVDIDETPLKAFLSVFSYEDMVVVTLSSVYEGMENAVGVTLTNDEATQFAEALGAAASLNTHEQVAVVEAVN